MNKLCFFSTSTQWYYVASFMLTIHIYLDGISSFWKWLIEYHELLTCIHVWLYILVPIDLVRVVISHYSFVEMVHILQVDIIWFVIVVSWLPVLGFCLWKGGRMVMYLYAMSYSNISTLLIGAIWPSLCPYTVINPILLTYIAYILHVYFSAVEMAKSWVAHRTTHVWWLGGLSQFWVVIKQ